MSRNYDPQRVIAELNRKHDIHIEPNDNGIGGVIKLLHGSHAKGDIGLKSKGKIAFLENYEGYRKQWVS